MPIERLFARAVSRAIPTSGLFLVELPMSLDDNFIDAIVAARNEGLGELIPPAAVRVTNRTVANSSAVHFDEVESYRTGDRVFVFRQGEYVPRSSMTSTAQVWMSASFPAAATDCLTVERLASALLAELRESGMVVASDSEFEASLLLVLTVYRECFEIEGGGDRPWTDHWWSAVAEFVGRLTSAVPSLRSEGLTEAQAIRASANLPSDIALDGSGAGGTRAKELVELASQVATRDQRDVVQARIEARSNERVMLQVGLEAVESMNVQGLPAVSGLLRAFDTGSALSETALDRARAWAKVDQGALREALGEAPATISATILVGAQSLSNAEDGSALLPGLLAEWTLSAAKWRASIELTVLLDTTASLPSGTGQTLIKTAPKRLSAGAEASWESSAQRVTIKARLDLGLKADSGWPTRATVLTIALPPMLYAYLGATVRVPIMLGAPDALTLVVLDKSERLIAMKPMRLVLPDAILGRTLEDAPAEVMLDQPLLGASVWLLDAVKEFDTTDAIVTVGERPFEECGEGVRVLRTVDIAEGTTVQAMHRSGGVPLGRTVFTLDEQSGAKEWLPISAAMRGAPPSRDKAVPERLKVDVRGELETDLRNRLAAWKAASGVLPLHSWVMLVDDKKRGALSVADDNGVVWVGRPGGNGDIPVSELSALRALPAYQRFSDALYAVVSAVDLHEPDCSKEFWVSRWSLSRIDAEVIDEYLRAWTELVSEATPKQRLWANFPLSLLVADKFGKVHSVLMSPLHPLRLAWLWSIERSVTLLSEATLRSLPQLLQLVEGWNFPAMAGDMRRGASALQFIAIPLWPGEHQLFLGWAALTDLSSSTPNLPKIASGRALPAGGSSGLTSGAVAAAVNDYLKVFPYLSALTMELHASEPVARSWELDEAVIEELASRGSEEAAAESLKFIQVLDSTNRLNATPAASDVLSRIARKTNGPVRPFAWTRVSPDEQEKYTADIRLVENSQTTVTTGNAVSALGSTGTIPFRRIATRERSPELGVVLHYATGSASWRAFELALLQIERHNNEPATIVVEPTQFGLGTERSKARWIVTGSSLLDPATLGSAMQNGQLLWEWRPAAASRAADGVALARRPYLTIAKVPDSLLRSLQAFEGVPDERAARALLSELGQRGVGLAALIGLGGHHAEGALGFYLGFRLLTSALSSDDSPTTASLILPFDAVHGLLEAVVSKANVEKEQQRADLLWCRIEYASEGRARIALVPVEIRCSSMRTGAIATPFPSPAASVVKAKVAQVQASLRLLSAVSETASSTDAGIDHPVRLLAGTALAALVEAGIAMTEKSVSRQLQSAVLTALQSGECDICAAPGLLLWFQKDTGVDGVITERSGEHTILMVNPIATRSEEWTGDAATGVVAKARRELNALLARATCHEGKGDAPSQITPTDSLDAPQVAASARVAAPPEVGSTETIPRTSPESELEERPSASSMGTTASIGVAPAPSMVEPINDGTNEPEAAVETEEPRAFIGRDLAGSDIFWAPMRNDRKLNNAHMVVVGAAGSGKTATLKAVIADISRCGVPSIVLDFKDDYQDDSTVAAFKARRWDVRKGLPFNPLALPIGGSSVIDLIYGLKGILTTVYRLGDQQAATLKESLEEVYRNRGFLNSDTGVDGDTRLAPTLDDLKAALASRPGTALVLNRLGALFDFELFRPDRTGMGELLRGPGIIRFTSLPQEELKSATAALFLRALYLHLQQIGHSNGQLRLLLVIDEAHRVANLEEVKLLVKEARAYGVGVVLSTQEATDLQDWAFSNAGTLVSLKLAAVAEADRIARMVSSTQGEASSASSILRGLPSFHAIIRNDHYTPYRRVLVQPFHTREYE